MPAAGEKPGGGSQVGDEADASCGSVEGGGPPPFGQQAPSGLAASDRDPSQDADGEAEGAWVSHNELSEKTSGFHWALRAPMGAHA